MSHENKGDRSVRTPPPKTQPLKVLPAQTVMRIIGERRWMRRMPRGARSASPQQPPKIPHPVPPPGPPPVRAVPAVGCGGLRVAAALCASATSALRRRFCLLAQPGLQCSPSQRPAVGGGRGGVGR